MKKYCIILVLLCLQLATRGQTYGYSYWFDNGLASKATGTSTTGALHIDADASALADGFHTLHVAVDDGQGTVVRVENAWFLKTQTDMLRCIAYVDGAPHSEQTVPAGSGGMKNLSFDVSNVPTGLHQLHLMATTQGGTPVATYTTYFVRMATNAELGSLTARCYVDGLLSKVQPVDVNSGMQTVELDLEKTSLGIHRLDVTLQTLGSAPVAAYSRYFIRNAADNELDGLVCTTFIDGVEYSRENISTNSGVHNIQLDVNNLPKGLHHLHLSAQTTNGKTTSIYNAFFLRMANNTQLQEENMKIYYRFDTGQKGVIGGTKTENGYHFEPDVSALPSGLHYATFMFTDGSSTHGDSRTVFFYKDLTMAANRYMYWINGDTAAAKTVSIADAGNPTKIVASIPVDSYPLRPSRFHFEVQDDKPYAYAINDLTMRFYNEFDASVDTTKSFIDVNVGGEVTQLTRLHPEVPDTRERIHPDSIRWYVMTLAEGSGLEVKTSHHATAEIFSPTGERIHRVSGDDTQNYTGPTEGLPEGTYWLAVHSEDTITKPLPDDISVWARFTEPEIPITYHMLAIEAAGPGYVTVSDTITVRDGRREIQLEEGTPFTLRYVTDDGCRIVSWTENGQTLPTTTESGNTIYGIDNAGISQSLSYVFVFEEIPITYHYLTIDSHGVGEIDVEGYEEMTEDYRYKIEDGKQINVRMQPINALFDVYWQLSEERYGHDYFGEVEWTMTADTTLVVEFMQQTYDFVDNGITYYITDPYSASEASVGYVDASVVHANIPEQVRTQIGWGEFEFQIRGVMEGAFSERENLVSVSLPASATQVGSRIFSGSNRLAAIEWAQAVPMSSEVTEGMTENPNLLVYVTDRQYAPADVENIVVSGRAERITLHDARTGNDFYCPTSFTAGHIAYTHHYGMTSGLGTAHGWESIALPYTVQHFTHETKGEIQSFAGYTGLNSRVRPFWLAELGSEGFHEVETIRANTPCIICMPNNPAYYTSQCLSGNVTFWAENAEVMASSELSTGIYGDRIFTPNFQQTNGDEDYFVLNAENEVAEVGGDGDRFIRNHRTAHAFEGYIVATGASGAKGYIEIFEDMANAIGIVRADANGMYRVSDLTGRQLRVTSDRSRATEGLPTGIYIINDQKVFVQ